MTTLRHAPAAYTASSNGTRAGFMGLATLVTFVVLTSLGSVADHQVEDVLMDQALAIARSASAPQHS